MGRRSNLRYFIYLS